MGKDKWQHIVFNYDPEDTKAQDRLRLWLGGVEIPNWLPPRLIGVYIWIYHKIHGPFSGKSTKGFHKGHAQRLKMTDVKFGKYDREKFSLSAWCRKDK